MRMILPVLTAACLPGAVTAAGAAAETLRAPAVPLVACDPYFSVWSCADRLTDGHTRHWTGATQALASLIRVDGEAFRLMGPDPAGTPAMEQESVQVLPTRTIYRFRGPKVQVTLTFLTPSLPDDLEALALPITYLTWEVRSTDGRPHAVSLYFDATGELVVNEPGQAVTWSREQIGRRTALRMGSKDQPVLMKRGDNLRIDWGYLYAMPLEDSGVRAAVAPARCREMFAAEGTLPEGDDTRQPRAAGDDWPVMAFAMDLGRVGARAVSRTMLLAYDDLYGIQYFRQNLRSYWRRKGAEAADLLQGAAREFDKLRERCTRFDKDLMEDLGAAGGPRYASICALAFRQCLAGNKLAADANGRPLLFPKECFSNGCIATVDVIYPMMPFFLLLSPTLTKASLVPILDYSASERWRFPFAPHDLGTYPQSNGQVYGGGERTEENQMPVEESANMLLLLAALAHTEGNADFAGKYWPVVTRWAEYLKSKGFDPENQLCTDDFAGHLAHNVNLSVKAILALAAYGRLCDLRGDKAGAGQYASLARDLAAKWVQMADDGDHFRLAFDRAGTWSQKYNLVWDRILGLGVFPESVATKEVAWYRKSLNAFGLPLDNRKGYTKIDWTLWSACLTGRREDFDALLGPVWEFLCATPDRVPMTDWYQTAEPKKVGFQARPVVGGLFLKMLYDEAAWKKWAGRDRTPAGEWAPLPVPPETRALVPTSEKEPAAWRYTPDRPAEGWQQAGFDDSAWQEGPGGFGTKGTPGAVVRTDWHTADIWLRREVTLPDPIPAELFLRLHHDEDVEVYVNGVLACQAGGYAVDYGTFPMAPPARAALKPGRNTLAVHCHQTTGGQYVDVGLVELVPAKR